MSEIILIFIVFGFIFGGCCKIYRDYKWNLKPIDNFPFIHHGKEYWYNRGIATSPFVFCKNEEDKWCVLANKRGEGTPDFKGFWNVPCGYLQFHVSGEENCQKEVFEECGVNISADKFEVVGVETSPKANRQNVSIRYCAILDGTINDYKTNSDNSEENEVDDIKWIPLDEVENYKWAFKHNIRIKEISEKVLN